MYVTVTLVYAECVLVSQSLCMLLQHLSTQNVYANDHLCMLLQ
eukprot:COSAG03_NODE_22726_length_287_cov_1.361702_1_plen_42_part_10